MPRRFNLTTTHAIALPIGLLVLIAALVAMNQYSRMRYSDEPPTLFHLMSSRYEHTLAANAAFEAYGVKLAGIDKGGLIPEPVADDGGIILTVPPVAHALHISVPRAYDLVLGTALLISALCGYFGFKSLDLRAALLFLFVVCFAAVSADYYIFQALPGIAGIPWLFRFASERRDLAFGSAALMTALWAGVCNMFRSGSGTPYIALILVLLVVRFAKSRIVFLVPIVIAIFLVPGIYVKKLTAERDQFLAAHGAPGRMAASHPIWHSVYIGLGWIHNAEVPRYQDEIAHAKVKSIDPSAKLGSVEYERILRRQVYLIATRKPWIILVNVAAKLVTVAFITVLLTFPAWRLWRQRTMIGWFDGAFMLGIVTGMLPGIVVTPNFRYILAGICCACLYSALSIQFKDRMKEFSGTLSAGVFAA